MLESARFVIDKTIQPAKDLYELTKDLDHSVISLREKEIIKKIYDQTVASEIVISRFKKTGDLHKYLQKSIESSDGKTKEQMNKLNLIPFEDILDEFEDCFKDQLNEFTTVDELILGDLYTTWDFVFLADVYRTQSPGILGVYNSKNDLTAVIARGNFKENNQTYNNEYLMHDKSKIKYYLIKGNHKFNRYITEQKKDVYFFETIGRNQQVFKGVYELDDYNAENNYIILNKRDSKSPKNKGNNTKKKIEKSYRSKFKPFSNDGQGRGGSRKSGEYKEKAGDRAEQIVSDYLNLKNIENDLMTETHDVHRFDIRINNLANLEVKNITNNSSFYLSNSQIVEYQSDRTRLCFVDIQKKDNLIYISKPYEKTVELKKLIKDYLELKSYSIKKYNGRLRVDSIEIGIITPDNHLIKDLYEDFILMNSLSRQEILDVLSE